MKKILYPTILLTLIIVGSVGFHSYKAQKNQKFIQNTLLLTELPKSIRNISCKDSGFTDILVTCYFELDADESDLLTNTHEFKHSFLNTPLQSDHSDCILSSPIGPDFLVAGQSTATPKWSEKGILRLCRSADKTQVLLLLTVQ